MNGTSSTSTGRRRMSACSAEGALPRLYTVGHGNRALDELIELIESAAVGCLVDVRAHPGSRRHPHFGRAALAGALVQNGVDYVWEGEALGGRRRPRPHSRHTALRNESFRAFADHMESAQFREGMERVLGLAGPRCVALMCAERLPWQCHRYLIADFLVAHGATVCHLIGRSAPGVHRLSAAARLANGGLVYDVGEQTGFPAASGEAPD
jgi:uncharacterized protein (DUF488 family)